MNKSIIVAYDSGFWHLGLGQSIHWYHYVRYAAFNCLSALIYRFQNAPKYIRLYLSPFIFVIIPGILNEAKR